MEHIGLRIIFGFIIAYCITRYMIPLCISLAHTLRIIDVPDGVVKNHKQPVPYLGGIGIFIGFITSVAFVVPLESSSLFLLIIGLSLIVFIGFLDDVIVLSPGQKIMGQIIVALVLVKAGFYLKIHAFYNPLTLIISFLWILTLMNAFNLVDIMDGLSTTLGICSGLFFFITAGMFHNYAALLLTTAYWFSLCIFKLQQASGKNLYGRYGISFSGNIFWSNSFFMPMGNIYMVWILYAPLFLGSSVSRTLFFNNYSHS